MAEETTQETTKLRSPIVSILLKVLPYLLAILAIAGATAYGIKQKPELLGLSKGPQQVQAEVDRLVSEVGKLIVVPSDEKPTVATITDMDKLKDQPFFSNAKNGDQVLIYTNARKAILYRPIEKRIIEVGAVNINQQEVSPSPSPSPTSTPTPQE
jgi:hypothetical protein